MRHMDASSQSASPRFGLRIDSTRPVHVAFPLDTAFRLRPPLPSKRSGRQNDDVQRVCPPKKRPRTRCISSEPCDAIHPRRRLQQNPDYRARWSIERHWRLSVGMGRGRRFVAPNIGAPPSLHGKGSSEKRMRPRKSCARGESLFRSGAEPGVWEEGITFAARRPESLSCQPTFEPQALQVHRYLTAVLLAVFANRPAPGEHGRILGRMYRKL